MTTVLRCRMETTWQDGGECRLTPSLSEACTPACLQASIDRDPRLWGTREGSSSWSPETDEISFVLASRIYQKPSVGVQCGC